LRASDQCSRRRSVNRANDVRLLRRGAVGVSHARFVTMMQRASETRAIGPLDFRFT